MSDTLTYSIVGGPTHGSYTLNNNIVTYTPTNNFNGNDSFTFKVNDGTVDSSEATVNITVRAVNDTPVANDDIEVSTDEDTAIEITLLGSDVDMSDTLTYSIVGGPTHGSYTLNNNIVTYTPTNNFNGNDSFTFKVNDGTVDSSEATVNITVRAVNDTPVANDDIEVSTDEDTAIEITLLGSDVDMSGTLTYSIVGGPTHGSYTLNNNIVTYTPNTNFNGTDSFTFNVNDSALATVSIKVNVKSDMFRAVGDDLEIIDNTGAVLCKITPDMTSEYEYDGTTTGSYDGSYDEVMTIKYESHQIGTSDWKIWYPNTESVHLATDETIGDNYDDSEMYDEEDVELIFTYQDKIQTITIPSISTQDIPYSELQKNTLNLGNLWAIEPRNLGLNFLFREDIRKAYESQTDICQLARYETKVSQAKYITKVNRL